MADDLYGEDSPAQAQAPAQDGKEDYPSTTIPKSLLMGKEFKVGDEIVLKIDQIGEEDVVVSYAPEKGKSEEAEGQEKPESNMDTMFS